MLDAGYWMLDTGLCWLVTVPDCALRVASSAVYNRQSEIRNPKFLLSVICPLFSVNW